MGRNLVFFTNVPLRRLGHLSTNGRPKGHSGPTCLEPLWYGGVEQARARVGYGLAATDCDHVKGQAEQTCDQCVPLYTHPTAHL